MVTSGQSTPAAPLPAPTPPPPPPAREGDVGAGDVSWGLHNTHPAPPPEADRLSLPRPAGCGVLGDQHRQAGTGQPPLPQQIADRHTADPRPGHRCASPACSPRRGAGRAADLLRCLPRSTRQWQRLPAAHALPPCSTLLLWRCCCGRQGGAALPPAVARGASTAHAQTAAATAPHAPAGLPTARICPAAWLHTPPPPCISPCACRPPPLCARPPPQPPAAPSPPPPKTPSDHLPPRHLQVASPSWVSWPPRRACRTCSMWWRMRT